MIKNAVQSLLYFLSLTDKDVVKGCTNYAKLVQLSLGFFVLLTGLVAYITMVYLLRLIFDDLILALAFSLIYAGFIILIDRMVVSSRNKAGVVPRMFLAGIVAIAVAIPLELALFENQIAAAALEKSQAEVVRVSKEIQGVDNEIISLEKQCKSEVSELQEKEVELSRIISEEQLGYSSDNTTGVPGVGKVTLRRLQERDELLKVITDKQSACQNIRLLYESDKRELEDELAAQNPTVVRGFLADYKVLQELRENDASVNILAWGVMLFILFIEITPALMKVTLIRTDYDHKLDLSIQQAIEKANNDLNIERIKNKAEISFEDIEHVNKMESTIGAMLESQFKNREDTGFLYENIKRRRASQSTDDHTAGSSERSTLDESLATGKRQISSRGEELLRKLEDGLE